MSAIPKLQAHPNFQPREYFMSTEATPLTLDQLKRGQRATVMRIDCEKTLRRRLLDMGLVTGETVTLTGVAPLGDPLELSLKGYKLSLRKAEARLITVEPA